MFRLKDLKSVPLKRSTSRIILYAILEKAYLDKNNIVQISQTYLADNYCVSRQSVAKELNYLQEEGYITYKRALYNNLTTTEITLTDDSIAILNAAQANKAKYKTVKTEETQPQVDASKPQNKPQNKPIKTEPSQPQAETSKTQETAPKQVETEQSDKVTCKSIEEVLELLNYQAERFADGKQNEFEFRRVAKYIASKNMQLSKNIRYDEDNNKFVNFA